MGAMALMVESNRRNDDDADRTRFGRLVKLGHVTSRQALVGERIRQLYEMAGKTSYAATPSDAGGSAPSRVPGFESWLAARMKMERAADSIGSEAATVLTCILIANKTVDETANEVGIHPKAVIPVLRVGLQALEGILR